MVLNVGNLLLPDLSSILLNDSFNTELNGGTSTNYNNLQNWNIASGSLDLNNQSNLPGSLVADGSFLDLDGSTNQAATLVSKQTFSFNAGDIITLQFDLAGSQRGDTNSVTVSLGGYSEIFTLDSSEPFQTITRTFQVVNPDDNQLIFAHAGGDDKGLLLDNVVLAKAAPMILLSDNFNTEFGGGTSINYNNLQNWNVVNGSIDLNNNTNVPGSLPADGLFLDLDGSTNQAGTLVSKQTFSFKAGDIVTLQFDLAGSQRGDTNTVTVSLGAFSETFTLDSSAPFQTITRTFQVVNPADDQLIFANAGGDDKGLLLDNVVLAKTEAASISLLSDNFNTEFGGQTSINYSNLQNWNVANGSVDLNNNTNVPGSLPADGLFLDMDGSTNKAATLVSKQTFSFKAGDIVTLQFDLAGSQRGDTNTVTVSLGNDFLETFTLGSSAPFQTITRTFQVASGSDSDAQLVFANAGGDNKGLLLDNVSLNKVEAIAPSVAINLSPSSQTVVEGLPNAQFLNYTVNLSNASNVTTTVDYSTVDGSAMAGLDYVGSTGTLVFAAGETTKTISIQILNDSINEPDEDFYLVLTNPSQGFLGTNSTATTIITDTLSSDVSTVLPSGVENLTLTGTAAINGTGNAANNVITGNAANNTLNGGAGIDTLIGGAGNDTYVVDSTTDVITELAGEGTDIVQSSVNFSLATLTNVENLTLTGAAINGTGNADNNVITGNAANNNLNGGAGADTLNGGAGIDTLIGGTGDDTYIVDSTTDVITELAGAGTDTVQSSVAFSLATLTNVENLTLTGTAINGTGK